MLHKHTLANKIIAFYHVTLIDALPFVVDIIVETVYKMADQEFSQANHVDQYQKQENYNEKMTELLSDNLPENGGGDASSATPGTQINASKNDDDERFNLFPAWYNLLIIIFMYLI